MENESTTGNLTFNNTTNLTLLAEYKITWDKIFIGCVLFLITAMTIVGNVLVLIAVKIEKKLQTSFNFYIVNLAITDVAVAVTAMSFQAIYTVLGYWPFGEILCSLWIFFDYGMTFVSVFTLILISVDRFWSVKWSIHYRKHHSKRTSLFLILCIWLFMLVLWVPPWLLDRIRYSKKGECFWDPSLNREFVFVVATLGHHGPYTIMLFCYTYVFIFMRRRAKTAAATLQNQAHIPASNSVNRNATLSTIDKEASHSNMPPKVVSVRLVKPDINSQAFSSQHVTVSYLQVPESSTSQIGLQPSNTDSIARIEDRQKNERRVFVTLSYIIFGYSILWLPFHVVFDISIVDATLVPEQAWTFAFWMAYINSTLNPLLYNFSSTQFRMAFKKILCRQKCC